MNASAFTAFIRRQPVWRLVVAGLGLALTLWLVFRPAPPPTSGVTFAARRGPLDISVLVGGSIEAMEFQELRSEVRGEPVKILKIVDEGYVVTDDDVRTNKVLIELDSSKLKQNLMNQDITFQSTLSALTEAQQAFEIQLNQNKVDVKAAEQKAKFAYMDLEKYLGDKITRDIVEKLGLREEINTNHLAALERGEIALPDLPVPPKAAPPAAPPLVAPTNGVVSLPAPKSGAPGALQIVAGTDLPPHPEPPAPPPPPAETKPPVVVAPPPAPPKPSFDLDFSRYASVELLGDGSAKQELRKRVDEVLVAKTELGLAEAKLQGTRKLHGKGFVTKTELENEEVNFKKSDLKQESAETARALFIKYEFPKAAEEFVSKYDEALRGLERARKEAVSKLAQARAKLKGAEGRFQLERDNRNEIMTQIDKCAIPAKTPGLAVYGNANQEYYWGGQEPIRVGAQVFERQTIITIPDTSKMGVKLGVHESHIKKVSKGLTAKIKVDAFPDEELAGEVTRVSVLPDSRNRWMNPDMKLYSATITIKSTRPWLKPGMSAKVEILVKQLADCLYIPVQAVSTRNGKQVVFLPGRKPREREVQVGEFNDDFIEIKGGLKENEVVMLRAPDSEKKAGEDAKPGQPKPAQAAPAAPQTASQ